MHMVTQTTNFSHQISQMADVGRWNKGRFDHVTHAKVTNPFRILAVSLVSFLRFRILEMGKGNKKIFFSKMLKKGI